ncbi:diaminopimelate epimerase [Cyanobium gracile UHCC 0281]|uniref:Diaminopimelate epimerase n=1 Tax=Cyanobium gracile UHCC 0281 TaxID=3110309 RepID=A0ABU5SX48_9CYAN|nr:diaminopimelate epimerase [Cyanobium gracile]MEA5443107.1 diaminopimelate epimerase [Cyanobium gracile UHCC 0281]
MLQFSKYQGLGNDFLLLDGRSLEDSEELFGLTPERVQRLCDRRFGVGGDGVILALPPREGGELRMRIFNADGSEPEMCGNGIRCLARFLADSDGDVAPRRWEVETLAGRIVPALADDGRIRVDMGAPFLTPETIPTALDVGVEGLPVGVLEVLGQPLAVAAAGMGNPHAVVPVDDVAAIDLDTLGAALEVHEAFPARTNVHFVEVIAPDHLVMRVWERGAGPTLACGTGACATLVACHLLGLANRQARLDLPGGPLEIDWDEVSGHVFMTGPAEAVFDGVVAPSLFGLGDERPAAAATPLVETDPSPAQASLDCATVCINGCLRPEACASADARARVTALLEGLSLDDLVALAGESLESRTRGRLSRDEPAVP